MRARTVRADARWRQARDLKVFGYIYAARCIPPRRGAVGIIVNLLGTAGERPTVGYIAGSAGNVSLIAFTRRR